MPVTSLVDAECRLAFTTMEGVVTAAEAAACMSRLRADSASDPSYG